jgi:hypothetical protein
MLMSHKINQAIKSLRKVSVTRYVTPLREGGSLPAIVEADDQFLYVLKFKGAGQGSRALIAELIGGEIARALGLRVPEIVIASLNGGLGKMEGDEEIQDLLKASEGLNIGLHYLSGSVTFDPLATPIDATLASTIVWLDSFLHNVDRTARNTNMLWWNKELWLIDHGASLYFHHHWQSGEEISQQFPLIKNHVLLPFASKLLDVHNMCLNTLSQEFLDTIISFIPNEWLEDSPFNSIEDHRYAYRQFFTNRILAADYFINEANHARQALI